MRRAGLEYRLPGLASAESTNPKAVMQFCDAPSVRRVSIHAATSPNSLPQLNPQRNQQMRWIFALLFIGVACIGYSTVKALASGLDDIQRGTLMLYSGTDGFCSGTLIAPDLILSAAHCTDAENVNVRVQTLDEKDDVLVEKVVYVKAVRTLKGWDVALFSPKGGGTFLDAFGGAVSVVDIASADEAKAVKLGDRLLAFGYPKAFQLQVTDGLFSGTKYLKGGPWEHALYKISAPITGGNSGGGLYAEVCHTEGVVPGMMLTKDVCTYKLLGVNVAGMRDVSFMNYASPHDAILAVTQGFVSAQFAEQAKLDKAGDGIDGK